MSATGERFTVTCERNMTPGCLLQIVNGAKAEGLNLRTAHPVTLLAEAYRREM